jgi:hypothetical protein
VASAIRGHTTFNGGEDQADTTPDFSRTILELDQLRAA